MDQLSNSGDDIDWRDQVDPAFPVLGLAFGSDSYPETKKGGKGKLKGKGLGHNQHSKDLKVEQLGKWGISNDAIRARELLVEMNDEEVRDLSRSLGWDEEDILKKTKKDTMIKSGSLSLQGHAQVATELARWTRTACPGICDFCKYSVFEFGQDNPVGHTSPVEMFKDNLSLCKRCYYVKRGSLNNMGVSDLVNHLAENEDFAEKPLAKHQTSPHTVRFARMRATSVAFMIQFPGRKYRYEKPDVSMLLERKESTYVDVASAPWL